MDWRCEDCGEPHAANDPPCRICGHDAFESAAPLHRRAARRLRSLAPGASAEPDAAAADQPTSTKWVCTECGREHPKHSPPCSRCGAMALEKREVAVDPGELAAPSYRELATPVQVAVAVVALLAASVVGLGFLGVVDLPGATVGGPEPPDAPGNATTAPDGTPLATLEDDVVATISDERAAAGSSRLRRTDDLDAIATFYTRWWVRSEHGDDEIPMSAVRDHLAATCSGEVTLAPFEVQAPVYLTAEQPGETVGERIADQSPALTTVSASRVGIDAHVGPDGWLYVTQVLC